MKTCPHCKKRVHVGAHSCRVPADVALVRRAVSSAGGRRALADLLEVNESTVGRWLQNTKIRSKIVRRVLEDIAGKDGAK